MREVRVLSDDWYGCARPASTAGAAIPPCDPSRGTVLLTRQLRYPACASDHPGPLIEVIERLAFFVAECSAADRVAAGGGVHTGGEDSGGLESMLDEALAMVASGEIADEKTIMLLQHAKLRRLVG